MAHWWQRIAMFVRSRVPSACGAVAGRTPRRFHVRLGCAIWIAIWFIPLYWAANAIVGHAQNGPVADSPHGEFQVNARWSETWIPGHMHTVVTLRDDPHSRGPGDCHIALITTTAWRPVAVTFAWSDDHNVVVTYPAAAPITRDETHCSVHVHMVGVPQTTPTP
jgi:hypothetical protein